MAVCTTRGGPAAAGTRWAACLPPPPPPLQTWCRGKKVWQAESLCLDCHAFSWRAYADPDFETPEQHEKRRWAQLVAEAEL
jgi:hypothetical protein